MGHLFDDPGDFEPCSSASGKCGINKKNGCLAIPQPDQYVSFVEHLEQHEPVGSFFAKFMIISSQ